MLHRATSVPLVDLFPFGESSLQRGNDDSRTVSLKEPIPFYGKARSHITVLLYLLRLMYHNNYYGEDTYIYPGRCAWHVLLHN